MRRFAALAASVRRVFRLAAVIGALGPAGATLAGDRALIDFVGYSGDARYFAFEEFGIQDGSGFAFSNLYLVDLANDRWVAGTPFRLRAEDETVPLIAVREQNLDSAAAALSMFEVVEPAQIVALVGDGEVDAAARSLSFGAPGYEPGAVIGEYTLELSSFPADSPEPCRDYLGERAKGYALTLSGDGPTRELHRDRTLPASRGCPVAYRLYAVTLPMGVTDLSGGVAIISVYPHGFEGPDRRFIAVPLRK